MTDPNVIPLPTARYPDERKSPIMGRYLSDERIAQARHLLERGSGVQGAIEAICDQAEIKLILEIRERRAEHKPIPFSWPDVEREIAQIENPPHGPQARPAKMRVLRSVKPRTPNDAA
jgi:hypothetical protein